MIFSIKVYLDWFSCRNNKIPKMRIYGKTTFNSIFRLFVFEIEDLFSIFYNFYSPFSYILKFNYFFWY